MPTRTSEKTKSPQNGADTDTPKTVAPETEAKGSASKNGAAKNGDAKSASAKSANAKSGKSQLSAEQIEHFQGLLLAERARLEEEREQIRSRSGSVDGALPEEGEGGDEDTADLASAMMDKEMDLSVEDEIEDLLGAVDHALHKIQEGTYGVCDMSGEPIPAGRLELIPWAALTVECQSLAEGQ